MEQKVIAKLTCEFEPTEWVEGKEEPRRGNRKILIIKRLRTAIRTKDGRTLGLKEGIELAEAINEASYAGIEIILRLDQFGMLAALALADEGVALVNAVDARLVPATSMRDFS